MSAWVVASYDRPSSAAKRSLVSSPNLAFAAARRISKPVEVMRQSTRACLTHLRLTTSTAKSDVIVPSSLRSTRSSGMRKYLPSSIGLSEAVAMLPVTLPSAVTPAATTKPRSPRPFAILSSAGMRRYAVPVIDASANLP